MKYVTSVLALAVVLSACGNKEADLKQSVEKLDAEKKELTKEYNAIKEKNDNLDEKIKANEDKLKEIEEKREAEIKEQIAKEEAAKKLEEEKRKTMDKLKQEERLKQQQKVKQMLTAKTMPNTIEQTTHGESTLVKSIDNVNLSIQDNGIESNVKRLQIFKITNIENQKVIFKGASSGYTLLYEVHTKNNNQTPVYYNNTGKLVVGKTVIYSDGTSFIPQELQESFVKSGERAYNEYGPKESTVSYKSITLDEKTYQGLIQNGGKLYLLGGTSTEPNSEMQSEIVSEPYTIS